MLFDTHTHIDQEDFDADRAAVVERARGAGVVRMLAVGTTVAASRKCVELAAQHEGVFAAVAVHPNYLAEVGVDDWAAIVDLASAPRVVAIGHDW